MNPLRREVLNGLFVLVLSTMLSATVAAFQIKFDLKLWLLIFIGIAIAASGYVVFELALGYMASTEVREQEMAQTGRKSGTPRIHDPHGGKRFHFSRCYKG